MIHVELPTSPLPFSYTGSTVLVLVLKRWTSKQVSQHQPSQRDGSLHKLGTIPTRPQNFSLSGKLLKKN